MTWTLESVVTLVTRFVTLITGLKEWRANNQNLCYTSKTCWYQMSHEFNSLNSMPTVHTLTINIHWHSVMCSNDRFSIAYFGIVQQNEKLQISQGIFEKSFTELSKPHFTQHSFCCGYCGKVTTNSLIQFSWLKLTTEVPRAKCGSVPKIKS